ncbi:MAG: hypothetical protein LBL16_04655 [Endomicrobium sp.]|jgi:hypothetical protein|nr:hypothetical protein [Endomicrobium sp.]
MLYKFPIFENDNMFRENQEKISEFDETNKDVKSEICTYGSKRTSLKRREH